MDTPLVSVIVPVYQVQKYIARCIDSICNQTYPNIEIVLVNDGSSDDSIKIADEVLKKYDHISYEIIEQENSGQATARNTGVDNAKGKWVVVIDSDDIIDYSYISNMVNVAEEQNLDLVITSFVSDVEDVLYSKDLSIGTKKSIDIEIYTREQMIDVFLHRSLPIILPGFLIRRQFLLDYQIRYIENMRYSEDVQYMWQLLLKNSKDIAYIQDKLYYYISHSNSVMTGSSIEKIYSGYEGMSQYWPTIENQELAKKIMARWVLGVMHSAARLLEYDAYLKLINKMEYKRWLRELKGFGEKKTEVIRLLFKISTKLGYKVSRRV